MNRARYDVVIVGAGIVGAACAMELAESGLGVLVIDSGIVAGGATGAGMGHILVLDNSEAQFALTRYSQRLWNEIGEQLPPDCETDACGTVWVAADDEELELARAKHDYLRERGVASEVLSAEALARHEPNLRPGLAGGLRIPGETVVYAPCCARYFLERAQARGAVVSLGKSVVELTGRRVKMDDGSAVSCGLAINAVGHRAPRLTPGLPIRARKGHLVITDRYPGFIRHQVAELGYIKRAHAKAAESVSFNIQPRITGQILIGSSRQFDVEDTAVETDVVGRMLARAFEFMPGLAELSAIRAWSGLRAATPDNLPLIGPWPGGEGLFMATGHEGLGITTSLGTAKLLADHILDRPPTISAEPYLPARFGQAMADVG